MLDPGFGAYIAFSMLGPVLLVGVIALAITVVAGGKEPDPSGLRVRAVYLALACFVSLFVMVGTVFAVASAVTSLIGESDSVSFSEEDDEEFFTEDEYRTENAVSGAVLSGVIGLAAAGVFVYHRRRMEEIIGSTGFMDRPARRAIQAYHYAVAFAAAFVGVLAAAIAAYSLYRIAAPGLSAPDTEGERTAGARQLLAWAALLGATGFLFLRHVERPRQWEAALVPAVPPPLDPPPPPPEIDLQP